MKIEIEKETKDKLFYEEERKKLLLENERIKIEVQEKN